MAIPVRDASLGGHAAKAAKATAEALRRGGPIVRTASVAEPESGWLSALKNSVATYSFGKSENGTTPYVIPVSLRLRVSAVV